MVFSIDSKVFRDALQLLKVVRCINNIIEDWEYYYIKFDGKVLSMESYDNSYYLTVVLEYTLVSTEDNIQSFSIGVLGEYVDKYLKYIANSNVYLSIFKVNGIIKFDIRINNKIGHLDTIDYNLKECVNLINVHDNNVIDEVYKLNSKVLFELVSNYELMRCCDNSYRNRKSTDYLEGVLLKDDCILVGNASKLALKRGMSYDLDRGIVVDSKFFAIIDLLKDNVDYVNLHLINDGSMCLLESEYIKLNFKSLVTVYERYSKYLDILTNLDYGVGYSTSISVNEFYDANMYLKDMLKLGVHKGVCFHDTLLSTVDGKAEVILKLDKKYNDIICYNVVFLCDILTLYKQKGNLKLSIIDAKAPIRLEIGVNDIEYYILPLVCDV